MNICSVAYTFYEYDYRVRRYAEALVERGNRVDMISLRGKGQKRRGHLNGVNIFRIQRREFNEQGLHNYIFRNIQFFIRASAILLIKHLKYRYKIIHIHNAPDFLVFTALIPKLLGARIILDMHENLPEFYCAKFNKGPDTTLAKFLLLLEKISTRFANELIAAHDLLRERIIARDGIRPENCTALLNYPSQKMLRCSSPRKKQAGLKIIYPGTISHHHGLDIAIRALAIVSKELQDISFDIYSRSTDKRYSLSLMSLIEDLRLNHLVKFLDPVPNEELAGILANATIGVVPKRGGIFASEAFSSKILDFMAAGVPVIASKTKIDEYYFDDSLIVFFEPENHQDLARCILELCNNPEKRKSLIRNANQFINQNNWETKKEVYYQIVDRLAYSDKENRS